MKIGIIGTGYVGLVSSVCLASVGHQLVSIDKREKIIESLRSGKSTIYEKDMDEMLKKSLENKAISFSADFNDLKDCTLIFLAVGTPSLPNGHADLSQVYSAIESLLPIVSKDSMIVVRSTVPVGTVKKVRDFLDKKGRERQLLGFCPEFLREGVAISDFLHPQYFVFACEDEKGVDILQEAYQPIIDANPTAKVVRCDKYETAELIKYTINSFLATKITFINQIAELAQVSNADIATVVEAIGTDKRIGNQFLTPGPGFGGSCFPKDTIALVKCGISYGVDMSVVEEVNHANQRHKEYIASWILEILETQFRVENRTIAVWGLAFKADTDDVRDSAAITIVESFFHRGARVRAYDPKGNDNFKFLVNNEYLELCASSEEATQDADVLVVLTEWKEFSQVDVPKIVAGMKGDAPIVFDTRGILNRKAFVDAGAKVHKFGI